ncbi:MAG: hypothetical protein DI573_07020 [Microbacterium sp.]|uniref:DUF1345 domain-containing protein n=1 Tax=Microbacterium sp. TaxID=51671 RepID=UPI000DAF47FE|nr:DUF1345 domain-containing protein [Microbacterium sp.]PZU39461.1 MAG: hypothetical protein DI573_07020 [Microbacterium sp.]
MTRLGHRARDAVDAGPPEHRWPPIVAVVAAMVLWLLLPGYFFASFRFAAVIACGLLIVPLVVLNPRHLTRQTNWSRWLSVALALVLLAFNQVLLVRLVHELLTAPETEGVSVLIAALQLWSTNAIAFGLLYWELDSGGPVARASGLPPVRSDFQFPQEVTRPLEAWRPRFFDYLYVSITAGIAFSPADALPLTRRAKAFMALEALSAYILSVLVIARAVSAVT